MAALYTDDIQKPARWPLTRLSSVKSCSWVSLLNKTTISLTQWADMETSFNESKARLCPTIVCIPCFSVYRGLMKPSWTRWDVKGYVTLVSSFMTTTSTSYHATLFTSSVPWAQSQVLRGMCVSSPTTLRQERKLVLRVATTQTRSVVFQQTASHYNQ